MFGIITFSFTCRDGIGSIPVPGVQVGDVVIWTRYDDGQQQRYQPPGGLFEAMVTVNDEVQQLMAVDASTWTGWVIVMRGVTV